MKKTLSTMAVALLALTGCTAQAESSLQETPTVTPSSTPTETIAPIASTPSATVSASATPPVATADLIPIAEQAAESELPDAPIWEGMRFKGSTLSDSEICVDRTWRDGGGIDGKGGSAGYVIVEFPSTSVGEPQDGLCADAEPSEATKTETVPVPENLMNNPGLIVSSDYGEEWPLTIPYGVVDCETIVVAGRSLQLASIVDPTGREFAVNGHAESHLSLARIDPIWLDNPSVDGLKISIEPVVAKALSLCS